MTNSKPEDIEKLCEFLVGKFFLYSSKITTSDVSQVCFFKSFIQDSSGNFSKHSFCIYNVSENKEDIIFLTQRQIDWLANDKILDSYSFSRKAKNPSPLWKIKLL